MKCYSGTISLFSKDFYLGTKRTDVLSYVLYFIFDVATTCRLSSFSLSSRLLLLLHPPL